MVVSIEGISLLFVDDDRIASGALVELLTGEGMIVSHYSNGDSAIAAIREGLRYDIALIDRELNSKVSGDDVVLFSKELYANIPIISASCYQTGSKGADTFLWKPYQYELLLHRIADQLATKR